MRLNQVYVRHYGPIQKDLELDGGINVVRGPNESGKSLLVEALLKQLNDGSIPNPVVDGSPEGFVEMTEGSESYKLGDGYSLPAFCEDQYNQEIRSEDLRNIFVIRSGDLTFHENDNFYTHITDKLTGRRVEDIGELKDALEEEGRLTESTRKVSSDNKYNSAGSQLEEARSLKEDIEQYIEEAEEKEVQRVESEFFAAKRRKEELEKRVENLEKAKKEEEKQQRYEELVEAKETVEENLGELEELPGSSALQDIDNRLQELSEEEGQRSELEDQKDSNIQLAKWSLGAGFGAFGLLLLIGLTAVGAVAPILFLGGAGYFWYQARQVSSAITELSVKEENILSDARAAGLSFDNRDEIRGEISEIEDRREDSESENKGKQAVLERGLGFEADSAEKAVSKAESELEELEGEIDESFDVDFDAQELDEVKQEFQDVKAEREELEDDLTEHREKLQKFRERAYELDFSVFVGDRLNLEVENLGALDTLVGRLEQFILAIESNAEASRVAIEIFDEIQEEEKEETAELFEEGSRATEIFREITDGRYGKVTYDNEENQLKVVKSTGESFVPEDLSDGTRDQLYLSIRVALGEQILGGETGFFIMDDAFLTSDPARLETQVDVVEQLADDGWQIMYLSSKEDAVSALSSRCDNGVIELRPLE